MNIKKEKTRNVIYKIIFIILVVVGWQALYESRIFSPLIFPSAASIGNAVISSFKDDSMMSLLAHTMSWIGKGILLGVMLAFVFSILSICFNIIYSIYNMLVSVFDLLPGVALLPLAILWFGTGESTIIFLIVHSVVWPMSRNIIDGFNSTPRLLVETGKNIGLNRFSIVFGIYIPSAFPNILSGLRVGWARAWRAIISAEMIFGATSSGAGIGFYIFIKRNSLDIPKVYAALIVILFAGILIEYGIFANIENQTVKKWGMVK